MTTPYIDIRHRMSLLEKELTMIQESCKHDQGLVVKTPERIEGYSEKTEFINHCKCHYCGKYWKENQ
jgi:hypothetical protein